MLFRHRYYCILRMPDWSIFLGSKRIAMLPAGANPIYYVEDLLGISRVATTDTGIVCYDKQHSKVDSQSFRA